MVEVNYKLYSDCVSDIDKIALNSIKMTRRTSREGHHQICVTRRRL